jgi:Flp pilus assembly protein TadG
MRRASPPTSRHRFHHTEAVRHRTRDDRGAALVEFALIFPLLAMFLFGIFSGGIVLNRRMAISQAAREGARYGATVPFDQCTPTSLCGNKTWAELVRSHTVARSQGVAKTAEVCVALVEGSGTSPVAISATHATTSPAAACFADNSSDPGRRVQVQIRRADTIELLMTSVPVNTTARSVAKLEQ